jgi:DNA-binding MarR family transcriptional regulator
MTSPPPGQRAIRAERIEYVADHLVGHVALLTRLLVREVRGDISRTEGAVLRTLTGGPRRITELAELEGLAQPTMTLLIQRLEQRGWVERRRHADDGRVVLISVTDLGRATLEQFQRQIRAVLRTHMAAMSDDEVAALETATDTLRSLLDVVQGEAASFGPTPA